MKFKKYSKKSGILIGDGGWEDNEDLEKLHKIAKQLLKAKFMQKAPKSDGYVYPYITSLQEYEDEHLDSFIEVLVSLLLDELNNQGEIKKETIR